MVLSDHTHFASSDIARSMDGGLLSLSLHNAFDDQAIPDLIVVPEVRYEKSYIDGQIMRQRIGWPGPALLAYVPSRSGLYVIAPVS